MKIQKIPLVHLQLVRDREITYGGGRLDTPEKAAGMMKGFPGDTDRECFAICCTDSKMKPTCIHVVGIGKVNACLCSVPEIFKAAILSNASSILLFHTHPSGEAAPSSEDMSTTKKIRDAEEMLGIPLQDHVILGSGTEYFSFRENGYWEKDISY